MNCDCQKLMVWVEKEPKRSELSGHLLKAGATPWLPVLTLLDEQEERCCAEAQIGLKIVVQSNPIRGIKEPEVLSPLLNYNHCGSTIF